MAKFIPGLKLSEMFYKEAVRPILAGCWPRLKYSAALIGYGSDVQGFDDEMSSDHEWGPRVRLFLSDVDHARLGTSIKREMAVRLPRVFKGYSTHFHRPPGGDSEVLTQAPDGSINHRAEPLPFRSYFLGKYALDPDAPMTISDWLSVSGQTLREITHGRVFHDGLKRLESLRARLRFYPKDVWLYLLACQWTRVGQEESFVGRTGLVGDDIGSRIVAARLVRDLMRLLLLMEKQYAPYSKWFGTAFKRLNCAKRFMPVLEEALAARTWRGREKSIATACEMAARMHNSLRITPPLPTGRRRFHGRPFTVIDGDRFAGAILKRIRNRELRAIDMKIGAADQFSDSCDLLDPGLTGRVRKLFEPFRHRTVFNKRQQCLR